VERARGRGRRRRGEPLASPSPPAPTTQGVDGCQRRSRRRSPATGSLERPCLAPPLSNGWRAPWRPHRPMGRASACGTAVEWNALPTPKQEPLIPRTRLKLRRGGVQPWRPNLTRAESLHAEAAYPKASSSRCPPSSPRSSGINAVPRHLARSNCRGTLPSSTERDCSSTCSCTEQKRLHARHNSLHLAVRVEHTQTTCMDLG